MLFTFPCFDLHITTPFDASGHLPIVRPLSSDRCTLLRGTRTVISLPRLLLAGAAEAILRREAVVVGGITRPRRVEAADGPTVRHFASFTNGYTVMRWQSLPPRESLLGAQGLRRRLSESHISEGRSRAISAPRPHGGL